MKKKLIVMDMDGTLLNSQKKISEKTRQVLIEMQQAGHRLVLASGRVKSRLHEFALSLQMDQYGGYLIEANGCALYHYEHNKRTIIREMTHQEAEEVCTCIQTHFPNHEIMIMADINAYVFLAEGQSESGYFNTNNMESLKNREIFHIQSVYDIEERFFKVCTFDTPAKAALINERLNNDLAHKYWTGRTMPFWVEVLPKEISKGTALQMLMDELVIDANDVYTFGDGENDIAMLTFTQGVAMQNALDSVKQHCQYETLSNDEDGIAVFLNKHLGGKYGSYS